MFSQHTFSAIPNCSIGVLTWIVFFAGMISAAALASASTTIPPGEVSGTWSVAGSPYVVQGDVEIPWGETLVIEPGVTVQFETDAGLSANGTLTAVGATASLIHFTSAQVSPSPGDWEGLEIQSSSSSLAWIQIDYAVDGLLILNSSPTISDCTVRNNAEIGIRVAARTWGCSGSRSAPVITRCQVELNLGDGVEYYGYGNGSVGCSIPKTGSVRGTLSASGVHHNTGTGIVIRANNGFKSNGRANPEVLGCDIHDNGGNGILLTGYSSTGPTINGSDVYLNTQSGIVRESSHGTATITNNELRENTGAGLRNSTYQMIVSGNRIINNNSEGVVTSQLRQFSENTLYGNADDYDFFYLDTVDQVAPLNDWGTADPAVIDSHIWDRLDNPKLGRVFVSPATDLVVTPEVGLEFFGQTGGPFYPLNAAWTLWNTQADPFEWEISNAESWLAATPLSGNLTPFDSVSVTADTSAEAESLPPGAHTITLTFQNTTTGDGDTQRNVWLSVTERHLAFVGVQSDEGGHGGADSVAMSPDGAHLFVVTWNRLAVYVRDSVTGALSFLEEHEDGQEGVDGLRYASSVTLSPDGENVYVTASSDNAIAVFDRNPVTGALTFLEVHKDGSFGVDGLDGARSVDVSPDGAHVYVASSRFSDGAVAVFARNTSTGRLTFIEVHKDGVGGVVGLEGAESLALSPDGTHVYVAAAVSLTVFMRDTGTGTLTFLETHEEGVNGVDGLNGRSRVALSPDGAHVYVTSKSDDSVALFARGTTTGTLTFRRVYEDNVDGGGLSGAAGLAISRDGGYLYVVGTFTLSVFRRDAATGELQYVERHRNGVDGVDRLSWAQAVAVSPDGTHVYAAPDSSPDTEIVLFSLVSALVADLSIAKSDSIDPVVAGGAFDYTLNVTNSGPDVAWIVRVEDALPVGVSLTSATGTGWYCSEDDGLVTCSTISLDVGTAPLLTLSVKAPLKGGVIRNTALVDATSFDPDTSDNNASEQTALDWRPTGIRATDGKFSDRVRVTFNLLAGATVYRVFRCPDNGNTCGLPIGYPKTGTFDDRKAVPGIVYYYRVKACNTTTCGNFSVANTGFSSAAPAMPTGITATDGMYVNRVQVTWNAVNDATTYRVYRCMDSGLSCGSPVGFRKTTTFNDLKGTPEQVYFYRIKACNTSSCSDMSDADTGYAAKQLDRPTGIRATDGAYQDRVVVTWNSVEGAYVYRVFRCLDTGPSCGLPLGYPKATSFDDKKGDPGTVYYYRVRACTADNCGLFSVVNTGHRGSIPSVEGDETGLE